jgi:uncharacterized protein
VKGERINLANLEHQSIIARMFSRTLLSACIDALAHSPALVLLGPRQVGKTTLALSIAEQQPSVYLDLQSPADRARLQSPELYLAEHTDKLVILDEIHHLPGLFPVLRGLIDKQRRKGRKAGMYLLLGSASMTLMRQSGESLAGRAAYLELAPLAVGEVGRLTPETLWLRGGFPDSLLAANAARSMKWRQDFIRTYLERDIPQLGPRIAAEILRRFWTMLAHHQGAPLNAAALARSLGVDGKTVANYLDLMVDMLLVRRLQAWHANVGKRLVKAPKVLVRDSGLLHALLGLPDMDALAGHPAVGASWECFVIEQLFQAASLGGQGEVQASHYRSSGGAEIDLVLTWPHGPVWAVEIKRSLSPTLGRGFYSACEDVKPDARFVVYPGQAQYPLAQGVVALPLQALLAKLNR